jgi:hypothetical protein
MREREGWCKRERSVIRLLFRIPIDSVEFEIPMIFFHTIDMLCYLSILNSKYYRKRTYMYPLFFLAVLHQQDKHFYLFGTTYLDRYARESARDRRRLLQISDRY